MIEFHITPFVAPLTVSAALCVAMLPVAWRNRMEPVAPWFAAAVLALLGWTVCYMLELMASGFAGKIIWADLQFVASVALSLLWFQVVLLYVRRHGLSRRQWIGLCGLGALVLAGVFFNPARLFRMAPSLVTHGSLTALHPDYGLWWAAVWAPFVYGLLLAASVLLVRATLRDPRLRVPQSLALLAASLLPLAAGTVYALGLSPWPDYNPAMAVASISIALLAYALFSSHLFELRPLARDVVIEHLADGVLILDRRGRLIDVNPAAVSAFPELASARRGQPVATLSAPRESLARTLREACVGILAAADGHGVQALPEVEVRGRGEGERTERVYSLVATLVRNGAGTLLGLAVVLRDVSDRVERLDEAVRLAATDSLTGVLTRRRLLELGEQAARDTAACGQPLTLLLVDVDHLKKVNDRQGHAGGDQVLAATAEACRHVVRQGDLIGRLGGDEFCVVLPGADEEEGRRVAERIRFAVSDLRPPGVEAEPHASVSIGVATRRGPGAEGFAVLLEAADGALYAAKGGGRNRVAVAGGGSPPAGADRRGGTSRRGCLAGPPGG